MSIDMLIGTSGSGKSYEAVVFYVVPALLRRRKIITNMPLNRGALADYCDEQNNDGDEVDYRSLIDIRKPLAKRHVPFSNLSDYSDPWQGEDGVGPLYIVDEAHLCLPKRRVDPDLEHWFMMHRHEGADVLLIDQQKDTLNKHILGNVQTFKILDKLSGIGFQSAYQWKLFGQHKNMLGGGTRKYDPQFFPLYKSHTRRKGVTEYIKSGKNLFLRWPFLLLYAVAALLIIQVSRHGFNPIAKDVKPEAVSKLVVADPSSPIVLEPSLPSSSVAASSVDVAPVPKFPLPVGYIWIAGAFSMGGQWQAWFQTETRRYREYELEAMGMLVDLTGPCAGTIVMGQAAQRVDCRPSSEFALAKARRDEAYQAQRAGMSRPVQHASYQPAPSVTPIASLDRFNDGSVPVGSTSKGAMAKLTNQSPGQGAPTQNWKVQFPN